MTELRTVDESDSEDPEESSEHEYDSEDPEESTVHKFDSMCYQVVSTPSILRKKNHFG